MYLREASYLAFWLWSVIHIMSTESLSALTFQETNDPSAYAGLLPLGGSQESSM